MTPVLEVARHAARTLAASGRRWRVASRCARAKFSASSDRTAAASRRCSTAFSASCTPSDGEVQVDGQGRHRHAPLRSQPARRQPDVPVAAGVPAIVGARKSHSRRAGASGHDAVAPVRSRATPGSTDAADQMIDFFKLDHLADSRGRPVLRPAEAARRRDGVHGAARGSCCSTSPPAASISPCWPISRTGCARSIASSGATFVVIEHNMEFVMSLCSRIIVLAEGKMLAEGRPEEVRANPAVIEAYLGH